MALSIVEFGMRTFSTGISCTSREGEYREDTVGCLGALTGENAGLSLQKQALCM